MSTLKEKRNIVYDFIKNDNLDDLHKYVTENKVELKILNKSNFDILVIAIDYCVSTKFIQYIIQESYYRTLNYYLQYNIRYGRKDYVSPLVMALIRNNYSIADILLKKGANINFKIDNRDLFDYLFHFNNYNAKTIEYILEKGINSPSNENVLHLIMNSRNHILETVVNHFNFSNMTILQLLSFYKYQHSLTTEQFQNFFLNVINFTEDMYEKSIKFDNYTALRILILKDKKDKYQICSILFKILTKNNHSVDSFIYFLNNDGVTLPFNTKKFLDNFRDIYERKRKIRELVLQDNLSLLNQYIKENEFYLSYYNDKEDDILMFAIEKKVSYDMIKYILSHCYYSTFNYTIGHSQNPLLEALYQSRFDVATLLISYGADINYKVFFNDPILYFLYYHKITPQQLRYCVRHGVVLTDDAFDLVYKLIENSQNRLLKVIFNQNIYSCESISLLLNFYRNKTKLSANQLMNLLYKEKCKVCIKKQWYKIAIQKQNYEALKILSNNDIYFLDKHY
ncbi:hypothetical protein PIROE2DRAFT_3474 [Piromyces sp. E2]|nr:hypothetical protein PIROE2DRAFT_3474 [Piromyces sp. E2]|eukprot:OUM68779.1 hypothetical protein PIROE2DRAFT_3474 [Piromyces sp. E2]